MAQSAAAHLPKKLELFMGLLFALIGIGVLIGAIYITVSTSRKLDTYVRIDAVVIDHEYKGRSDSGNAMYAEVVQYTVDGKTYTKVSNSSSNMPKNIGSKIEIAYNPYDPATCIFVSDTNIMTIIMYIIGVVFPLAGGSLVVKYVRDVSKFRKMQAEEYGYND